MKSLVSKIIILSAVLTSLWGCGGTQADGKKPLKVGVVSGPERSLSETAKKIAKEKYDLEVELVEFNDYVLPNAALNQGEIDVNAYQHKPLLDEQSKQRGYKLAVVGNSFVYPIVGYSRKIKSIDELKEGDTIVIPNDPSNSGRSLLLLEKQGLIKLKEGVGILPTLLDVADNPKKLKILELDAPQLPRILDDKEVTIAIINTNFAALANLDASKDGIFREDKDSPYVNIIVAREDNKNDERIQQFVKSFQTDEVNQTAIKTFKGGAIKGW